MAEYYPLLAKAVASLPNSTVETRKVVYERARKALIGQLRTLHPPVPDEDIQRESTALDSAVARLEAELAPDGRAGETAPPALTTSPSPAAPGTPPRSPAAPVPAAPTAQPPQFPAASGALGPSANRLAMPPLRTKMPAARPAAATDAAAAPDPAAAAPVVAAVPAQDMPAQDRLAQDTPAASAAIGGGDGPPRLKPETQRPFAPQSPVPRAPRRPLWILPVGIGLVVLLVAAAAYKLRDRPETLTKAKPSAEQASDAGKTADRVGDAREPQAGAGSPGVNGAARSDTGAASQETAPANPPAAVAGRAALLVEAPNEPNKVKTYLGTVVWRLDNVGEGQNQAVGLAVRADIDLPEDKMKVSVLFQKNTDGSLPASHTVKVRFLVQPGSASGGVKQINVPEMRREDSSAGDPLDGVTVPIVENSFLIGLRPGASESTNLNLLRGREWIDIPMYLSSSKIAKLTFEKTDAGQRDLQEAIAAWAKP